jgi:ribosomal protein S18 acetylase RimI-like enzyme
MVAGLQHLASPAATPDGPVGEVLLYVEADNEPALAMYTGLRFSVSHVDEQYRRSAG